MKVILERVESASVIINKNTIAEIQKGFLVLAGFTHNDTNKTVEKMAEKIINLRIMPDENEKMNKMISETGGSILAVPQFTLYADTSGRRPGFQDAAKPGYAKELFDLFVSQLTKLHSDIKKGVFGEHMIIESKNDGPLTLILEM
jgi:D-aminoacyl-tRNA deacylase